MMVFEMAQVEDHLSRSLPARYGERPEAHRAEFSREDNLESPDDVCAPRAVVNRFGLFVAGPAIWTCPVNPRFRVRSESLRRASSRTEFMRP